MKTIFLTILLAATQSFAADKTVNGTSLAIQTKFPRAIRSHYMAAIGTSLTLNSTLGVRADQFWPAMLQADLIASGYPVTVRNLAHSGDTSSNMVSRAWTINQYFGNTLDVFAIEAGANDIGTLTNQLKTNIVCLARVAMFGAAEIIATENLLPSNNVPGIRYVVAIDGANNSGASQYGGLATNVSSSIGAIGNVWECRNGRSSTNGWGRIATGLTTPTHCSKILVMGSGYLNWTAGGDNGATPASYPGCRPQQQEAVTLLNQSGHTYAVYVDNYNSYLALITSGQETQGVPWIHVVDGNQHPSAIGSSYFAQFAMSAMNTAGWLTSLK